MLHRASSDLRSVIVFFVLACLITWALDLPYVLACLDRRPPSALAGALGALSAFGPTLAAVLVVRANREELRAIFGRWRARPRWILIGLLLPLALHQAANVIEVVLGGSPERWFYPPTAPERIAALVLFSLGEEFGWRGFAYPRFADRRGPVVAGLVVGAVWALWHLAMMFTPEHGAPELATVAYFGTEMVAWGVIFAWLFERGGRSMAVAIALHAGGHLDNVNLAPQGEVRLRILRLACVCVVAIVAAAALARRPSQPTPTSRRGSGRRSSSVGELAAPVGSEPIDAANPASY